MRRGAARPRGVVVAQDQRIDAAAPASRSRSAGVRRWGPPGTRAWGSASESKAGLTHVIAAPPGISSMSTDTSAFSHAVEERPGAGMKNFWSSSPTTTVESSRTSATRPVSVRMPSRGSSRARAPNVSVASRVNAPPVSASRAAGSGSGSPLATSHSATNRDARCEASRRAASCASAAVASSPVRTKRATSTINDEYQTTRP